MASKKSVDVVFADETDDVEDDGSRPLLVCFGDGQPTADRVDPASSKCVTFSLSKKKRSRSRRRLTAKSKDGTEYEGRTFGSRLSDTGGVQYFIGIFDCSKSRLRLAETAGPLFTLKRRRLGTDGGSERDSDNDEGGNDAVLRNDRIAQIEAKNRLTEAFGSRKAKRAKRTRERGRITIEGISSDTKNSLDKRRKEASARRERRDNGEEMEDIAESALMDARRLMLPPFDIKATEVHKAYDIEKIITEDDVESMSSSVKVMRKYVQEPSKLATRQRNYPLFAYVVRAVELLRLADQETLERQLPRLVFLNMLLRLVGVNRRIKSIESLVDEDPLIPGEVLERQLSNFTQEETSDRGTTWTRTDFYRDRIIVHICLLALTIENYAVDPATLAEDLHVNASKVRDYMKQLGCVPKVSKVAGKSASRRVMALSAPLKFPVRRKARASRR